MFSNPILNCDAYKTSHAWAYPADISGMFSYIEARSKGDEITFFGLQAWLEEFTENRITDEDVHAATDFCEKHGIPFYAAPWWKIVNMYGGKMPLTIRALPEGTVVPSSIPLVTVECTDPDLFWLSSYIETQLQRAIWYPTTIASNDRKAWKLAKFYLNATADTLDSLPFMLHDFGARGVSSQESATLGGMAHMVYFMGSDTINGVMAANYYYDSPMAGFSVAASEHSVQCSFGPLSQRDYLNNMIEKFSKPGKIVSIVLDGYDVYREASILCSPEFVEKVKASGGKVVFRPDSGDPLEVIPRLLDMQASSYGFTVNSRGYKVINTVGIIQGDGIDLQMMEAILKKISDLGYSAQNIVFGSGGALLQKVNRDTYKFAQKASAITYSKGQNKVWEPIFKDPITDQGKQSKKGRVTAVRHLLTNQIWYADLDKGLDTEFEDMMVTVYGNTGRSVFDYDILKRTTLDEVRARAQK